MELYWYEYYAIGGQPTAGNSCVLHLTTRSMADAWSSSAIPEIN